METPQHLFALTRPEQRVVLLIILGLLGGAVFTHWHQPIRNPQATPIQSASPASHTTDDDGEAE